MTDAINQRDAEAIEVTSAVARTLYRFTWAYDQDDPAACAACFTEDGLLSFAAPRPADPEVEVPRGRDRIHAFFARARAERRRLGQQPRHLTSNVVVDEVDGDHVTAHAVTMLGLTDANGRAETALLGRYFVRLRKLERQWLIRHLVIAIDGDLDDVGRIARPELER